MKIKDVNLLPMTIYLLDETGSVEVRVTPVLSDPILIIIHTIINKNKLDN